MSHINRGLNAPEAEDKYVPLQFSYTFNSPFNQVAEAFIKKWHWETNSTLTTVSNIKQLDDDRVVFYRRCEHNQSEGDCAWEQIVINR